MSSFQQEPPTDITMQYHEAISRVRDIAGTVGEVLGPVLLWGPPLGDDPGAAVKSSSLLVVSTLNSTDIFLNPVGTICYLPNNSWALADK